MAALRTGETEADQEARARYQQSLAQARGNLESLHRVRVQYEELLTDVERYQSKATEHISEWERMQTGIREPPACIRIEQLAE